MINYLLSQNNHIVLFLQFTLPTYLTQFTVIYLLVRLPRSLRRLSPSFPPCPSDLPDRPETPHPHLLYLLYHVFFSNSPTPQSSNLLLHEPSCDTLLSASIVP